MGASFVLASVTVGNNNFALGMHGSCGIAAALSLPSAVDVATQRLDRAKALSERSVASTTAVAAKKDPRNSEVPLSKFTLLTPH